MVARLGADDLAIALLSANNRVVSTGGSVDDRVMQRARLEVIDEKIDNLSTKEELRDLLRFLAKEAGVT
ncbi:hypothetical protein [Burkholderia ambifaria]|uniref:hypothetical protein n=1 Tax=Burkholderia ambifaria TaxID=152480 RepID=UPI00158E2461|nr:hypothetical protein [Burkholderia ambifaria]